MKTLLAVAALALVACGPADTAQRAPDGGLYNVQCQDGTLVRDCKAGEFSKSCEKHGLANPKARPNGLIFTQTCQNDDCCIYPDGGRF